MNTQPENISPEAKQTVEIFDLPTGFVTEKGSAYHYNSDGSVHREKFDGTSHDMGIAVFIDDTPENLDVFTRLGLQQGHMPPERQHKAYILQTEDRDGATFVKGRVYNTLEVTDPESLAFALMNEAGQVLGWIPASLQPKLGTYVFEMTKLPDGKTVRHPGHRASDIIQ